MGEFRFSNGDVYVGEFAKNKFNGFGKYKWQNGDLYDGEFHNGIITGKGDMIYAIGVVGSGVWNE